MKKNMLWTEKYRPKKIADYIFHDQNQKKRFEKMISEGEIPHLLLSGVQGSGKTSLSGILVNELGIDPIDVLRINASDEKTESLREKVISFAQTYAIKKLKLSSLKKWINFFRWLKRYCVLFWKTIRLIADLFAPAIMRIKSCQHSNQECSTFIFLHQSMMM